LTFSESETNNIISIKKFLFDRINVLFDELHIVLANYLRDNAILTGGAIPSIFHGEIPNDYDLYLSEAIHVLYFKQYIPNMDQTLIQDADEKYLDVIVAGKLVTANATTFKNGLQVITMHTADARSTFDFLHCMPWYKISDNTLHISKNQYDTIAQKILVKNEHKNAFPLSKKRVDKYVKRGWKFGKYL
jgi:hypothetical protein